MKYCFMYIIGMFSIKCSDAQNKPMSGEYSLAGVMETASGIQLNPDSSFQFYFSYGALDRFGTGKWSTHDEYIILNSRPYPGNDFKLVKTSLAKNNVITVKIEDPNRNLYRLVYCLIKRPDGDTVINADNDGVITIPYAIDSIHLLCELCSERMTSFPVLPKNNGYTFNFEPWITEVFFKSFRLRFAGDHLQGRHPLLDDKEYDFTRVK